MSLPATLAATVIAAVVAHLLMRLLGRRYAAPERASRRLRRDLLVGSLFAVAGFAVAVLLAGGTVHPAVRTRVAGPPLLVTVLTFWGYSLCATAVVLAGYLGFLPAVRRTREVELGDATATVRMGRWLVVTGLLAATGAAVVYSVTVTPLTAAAAILVVALAAYLAAPWLIALTQSVRAPTDAELDRLDRLCAQAGATGYRLRVLDRRDEQAAVAFVRGPPGARSLYVTDYLLEVLDDDAVAAVLAVTVANERHTAYRLGVVGGVGAGLLAAVAAGYPFVALGLLVLAPLPAYALGRRLVFRADDRAASRVGSTTVADTLDRTADLHDASLDAGLLARIGSLRPSRGQRIDRLRSQS
ncbi:hypothetical protein [Halorarius litoreus]|uniref:hypothetical protein n=1 Tax=Halorarius litoreus TaxID=2962676 RepID=UPI0020CD796A|nr:hypothetical protein [Halorarius litoreus]